MTPEEVGLVRATITTLVRLLGDLPDQAAHGRQAYHEHTGLLGGDATVMLTPAHGSWDDDRVRPVYVELPGDVRPPLDVLIYWTRMVARETYTLVGVLDAEQAGAYLDRHLTALARSPIFPTLAKDFARLLHQVENVLYAGDRPDVSRVPCWECGTRLHKVWTDTDAHDYWRCPKDTCGELYDQGRYDRAQHDQLASRGADRFVPLMDAVAVTGRPEQTIRGWVRDGLVESRRSPGRAREVWWPDVRDRHRITPTRRRR